MFDDKVADKINKLLITVFPITQKEYFERKKTDFLYSIYNGKTPTEFPKEVTPSDEVTKLHKHFTEHKYDKQLDFDDDESKGAEQRQKLSLLRDALLANK